MTALTALQRKLLRDLLHMRGQVLTVALVVASGIAGFAALRSTYGSLITSRDAYYAEYRFGDVFAHLNRAPETLRPRVEGLPGVARAYTRIIDYVRLPLEHEPQPPLGILVSIPRSGPAPLNEVRLERGRMPAADGRAEALLLTNFADRRGLEPGDTLPMIVEGVRQTVSIVGLANAPEFIYPVAAGGFSMDEERTAVIWMVREEVAPALGMEGAFNDVVLRLAPGASEDAVIAALDRLLAPYGGLGAVPRRLQTSHRILDGELNQLRSYATLVPVVFLGISAFLLNVVLSRLVQLQRGQVATLKAVGYTDAAIGRHYLAMMSVIVLLGTGLGLALGAWFGRALTGLYGDVFRFPALTYAMHLPVVGLSVLASLGSAGLGALVSARRMMRLPPAEALRPPAPAVYRPLLLERFHLQRLIAQSWRMVLRELGRHPLRALLSIAGIAVSTGTVVAGRFTADSVRYLLDVQYGVATREDLTVTFTDAVPARAVSELRHLPGVIAAEGYRVVPARVRAAGRVRDAQLFGYPDGGELRRPIDARGRVPEIPPDGMLVTEKLASILGVEPGDRVDVELLEGERRTVPVTVTGTLDELFGLQGHLRLATLTGLMREAPAVSMVSLRLLPGREADVRQRLSAMPRVLGVTSPPAERAHIAESFARSMDVTMLVVTLFAATIAVGVVYNNARIALSTRSRELASLRVLGFTRGEISGILLGELGVQLLVAIPPGLLVGRWLAWLITAPINAEQFRWPVVISSETYALAALVVLAAGAASALLVRRQLDRLDLIGVLKTRE